MNGNKTFDNFLSQKQTKVIFFDFDGTLIKGYSIKLFVNYLWKIKEVDIFFLGKVYLWFIMYKFKLIKKVEPGMKILAKEFSGKSETHLRSLSTNFFNTKLKREFYVDALNILQRAKNNNTHIYLVSNTFSIILEPVAQWLKVNGSESTNLEFKDGQATGNINGDIIYGKNKSKRIKNILEKYPDNTKSVFFSDHISDLNNQDSVSYFFLVNNDKIEGVNNINFVT